MKPLPVIISAGIIGAIILLFWAGPGLFQRDRITEDNLTLVQCTGDRFAFIQGTYLYPITEEEIAAEREAVLQRVNATGGHGYRAGGSGGGGPGESRIVAWGYCIDDDGVSSGFGYAMGNDIPSKNAIEESNRWYQEKIVNRSLDRNVTCTSRAVVERFRMTGGTMQRMT